MGELPLAGRTVVVTRASEQAGTLADRLRAAGAEVLEVPTIAIADPEDGGAALAAAAARLDAYDWVVVTSVNGAQRLQRAAAGRPWGRARLAAIGPGTAGALQRAGRPADLVPERFVAEGLLAAFPRGPGRVLLAQAEQARPVLADGLRSLGWTVDAVIAYRTVPAVPDAGILARAASADAVTFTSGSTVHGYLAAAGRRAVPPVVVSIGPVTTEAARQAGLAVAAEADPHTIDGLVAAVVAALADPPTR